MAIHTPETRRRTAMEVMSRPAIACRRESFLEEVAEVLADRKISGLPVVDDRGAVVGVVSERDVANALGSPLIRLAMRLTPRPGPFLSPRPHGESRVEDVMTEPAIVGHAATPLHTIAEIMVKEQVNRIPILEAGRLVGVVTRGDLLRALAGLEDGPKRGRGAPIVLGSGVRSDAERPIGRRA